MTLPKTTHFDKQPERVYYGLVRATGDNRSVAVFSAAAWKQLVNDDGSVTELTERPEVLSNPVLSASEIVSIASGNANASPGMMIARHDPKDAPTEINIDKYTVIEDLASHPIYTEVLKKANVPDSDVLRAALANNVYIVKEKPDPAIHWVADFPKIFLEAKKKKPPATQD